MGGCLHCADELQPMYKQIIAACGDFSSESRECADLITEMDKAIGNFDIYNIVCVSAATHLYNSPQYDTCGYKDYLTRGQIMEALREPTVTLSSTAAAFQSVPACSPLFCSRCMPVLTPSSIATAVRSTTSPVAPRR